MEEAKVLAGHTESPLGLSQKERRIIITRSNELQSCDFWIVNFDKSSNTLSDASKANNCADMFKEIADNGLNEEEPVLFTDSSSGKAYSFLFVPNTQFEDSFERMKDSILTTAKMIKSSAVGIQVVLSEHIADENYENLVDLICSIIKQKEVDLHLFYEDQQSDKLTNLAIRVKKELKNEDKVFIFH